MPKTLLLADDSVTIQKVVGITFANEDVELVTVDNGDDALTRARQVKPDLVLADIGMPGLNGYELCAAIRRDPNLAQVPVLLLTGTFETYDENRAREVGASGHIAKPFEAQALVDRVFQLLAQAKTASAAQPKPVAAPPRPAAAPAQSPAQSLPPRPAAPPAAPRARPELPPVPHAPPAAPKPAPAPAAQRPAPAAPAAAPVRPNVPPPKRESTPFEFELPDPPMKPAPSMPPAQPKAAPPTPPPMPRPAPAMDQEPIWEAEPEADVLSDEPSVQASHIEPIEPEPAPMAPPAPPQDATRLFAPDLLGRATHLPDVPEPPRGPARKGDFSFDDLDFEEPTNPQSHQSQIFGEASDASHEFEPEFAQPVPEPPVEVEALADPLYSQTMFLDPAARGGASATLPPLPDLLPTPQPRPAPSFEAESQEELDLAEADTALDDEPETPVPYADPQPFSADTAAALEMPSFARMVPDKPARPSAEAATRLVLPDEPETPVPTRLTPPAPTRPAPPAAEADTLPPTPRRAPPALRGSAVVDSTVLSQSVEKVAWEAFGALSEQVVGEVLKRVEAVVWEVVPQLCERLIREEIARLKAEMSE
ncbi:MAG TPA: response regulator [Myxococcota bacterium]|nr:response regulator [Myxococcota bacterium]